MHTVRYTCTQYKNLTHHIPDYTIPSQITQYHHRSHNTHHITHHTMPTTSHNTITHHTIPSHITQYHHTIPTTITHYTHTSLWPSNFKQRSKSLNLVPNPLTDDPNMFSSAPVSTKASSDRCLGVHVPSP